MTYKRWQEMSRREKILAMTSDLAGRFLYYDRKEDSEFPVGSIEEAIDNGEVTLDEIVEVFRTELTKR
jgi:hypothetical protein